ncbi:MAG: neutral/alkaline non-lysosomal ceramidase N-terminal domain-containing protein [Pirellulales bacterium]
MRELDQGDIAPRLIVGASSSDITPRSPIFLYGYPHTPRVSTGVHDPLWASAMFVGDRAGVAIFVSVDTIWLSKRLVGAARAQITRETGLPGDCVMITSTHTHSGPVTVQMLSNIEDPVVPPPDPAYLSLLVDRIVSAAVDAFRRAEPAEIALALTKCTAIGSNRIDPKGPTITEIPVVVARSLTDTARWLALMYVNPVHPTILHDDSTLISADFPGMCRAYLQTHLLGQDCPVLSHLGAAGNQSPRFIARAHTFDEVERIGHLLGRAIETAVTAADFDADIRVKGDAKAVDLPPRPMPTIEEAINTLELKTNLLAELKKSGSEYGLVRTAQCAVFGAEETVCLARAAAAGKLRGVQESCLPAEIQVIRIGNWAFVGWPGEVFVEFALEVRKQHPQAFVVTLANGELQGYIVTEQAVRSNCYEATNAIFASPISGEILVDAALELLARPAADKMRSVALADAPS